MRTTKEWKADVRASLACVAPALLDALRPRITGTELLALLDDADAAEEMRAALVEERRASDAVASCRGTDAISTLESARGRWIRARGALDALVRRLAEEADRG